MSISVLIQENIKIDDFRTLNKRPSSSLMEFVIIDLSTFLLHVKNQHSSSCLWKIIEQIEISLKIRLEKREKLNFSHFRSEISEIFLQPSWEKQIQRSSLHFELSVRVDVRAWTKFSSLWRFAARFDATDRERKFVRTLSNFFEFFIDSFRTWKDFRSSWNWSALLSSRKSILPERGTD